MSDDSGKAALHIAAVLLGAAFLWASVSSAVDFFCGGKEARLRGLHAEFLEQSRVLHMDNECEPDRSPAYYLRLVSRLSSKAAQVLGDGMGTWAKEEFLAASARQANQFTGGLGQRFTAWQYFASLSEWLGGLLERHPPGR